ncbi:cell division protein ZapA [Ignatzschineria rhizosphaerae]|uniref:Cell division protein ZapA n=1 Tax=Ignatzschineria rhizosphaerae TaxID=2923279 RepID=A0ABY3WZY7_9GAMM|nr:cell division protein ZapA [Ignatzschineria rhizosphaerae]UNM96203.1 cell division protein ZapA [Ignatzschineria rhizosphaerae]
MSENVVVSVKIANEEYPISTPKSEEEVLKESALRLDKEIAKLREKGRLSLEKAAVMAGIILASELVRAEKGIELTEFKLKEQLLALSKKVDEY